MTFQKGLGAVHSLSHAVGGMPGYRLHHGSLNAIFLPKVGAFNAGYVGEKMSALGRVFDYEPHDVATVLEKLNERIGLPNSLTHLDIPAALDVEIARGRWQITALQPIPGR